MLVNRVILRFHESRDALVVGIDVTGELFALGLVLELGRNIGLGARVAGLNRISERDGRNQ
ncbi:hypothetical protein FQZ97_1103450 [compost metagenome]